MTKKSKKVISYKNLQGNILPKPTNMPMKYPAPNKHHPKDKHPSAMIQ